MNRGGIGLGESRMWITVTPLVVSLFALPLASCQSGGPNDVTSSPLFVHFALWLICVGRNYSWRSLTGTKTVILKFIEHKTR